MNGLHPKGHVWDLSQIIDEKTVEWRCRLCGRWQWAFPGHKPPDGTDSAACGRLVVLTVLSS